MSRRRPRKDKEKSSQKKRNQSLRRYICEWLEPRKYLVVLHGGDVFEFWAENTHFERIVVTGNTTVEVIGAHIPQPLGLNPFPAAVPLDTMNGVITAGPDSFPVDVFYPDGDSGHQVGLGLPVPALPNQGGNNTSNNAPIFLDSIWAMYVSQSDVNSRIAVAGVPDLTTIGPRHMQPFTGDGSAFVAPTGGGNNITVTGPGAGIVFMGAKTVAPQGVNGGGGAANFPANEPRYEPQPLPVGVQTFPASITSIGAGLIVEQGNNLGQFLFGGTISGTVDIRGSINLFYTGWLLTGNALGVITVGANVRDNFNVDGDIRTLLVNDCIGTDTDSGLMDLGAPHYLAGFSMHVGGTAGMIKSLDSFVGNVDVSHSAAAPNLDGLQFQQLDVRGGNPWDTATFGTDGKFNDTTFAGAQFLGTIDSSGDVQVTGATQAIINNNKPVDYYAVPLMAGQTVTAQLSGPVSGTRLGGAFANGMVLGIFDSEQRLVATDYNAADLNDTIAQPFQFTAKIPGIYYFAVTGGLNNTFDSAFPEGATLSAAYTLTLANVGDLGLGGIAAATNLLSNTAGAPDPDPSVTTEGGIHVVNGDLGAAFAGGLVFSAFQSFSNPMFQVDNGNLRAVEGASLGNGIGPASTGGGLTAGSFAFEEGPGGVVPNGSIGMLRATSTANASGQGGTGVLLWNGFFDFGGGPTLTPAEATPFAIGGDFQMIDAANLFYGDVIAQGNLGTLRAAGMNSDPPSYIQVNALDDPNRHGTIDLIDVSNQLGYLGVGGPAIITGPGGNCRYIHIGVGATIFRDVFFGGGAPEATLYQPGETASITDDSGSVVNLTPQSPADSLIVTTYPIRGSGGAAIVRVEVTNTATQAAAEGLTVATTGGGTAEIGSIILDGTGTAVTPGVAAPPPVPTRGARFTVPTLPTAPTINATTPMDVAISGSAKVDVYEISGILGTAPNLLAGRAEVTSITNNTPGEIVNVHLNSLGTVAVAGTLGAALEQNTPSAVLGNYITHKTEDGSSGAPYTYPLFDTASMVRVLGNIVSISAGNLGDVYAGVITNAANGTDPVPVVNTIPQAIPDGSALIPASAGAVGAIVAGNVVGSVVTAGAINSVTASGIGWQGSGALIAPGIFSTAFIGPVTVHGDDRGVVESTVGIAGLTVSKGSLFDAAVTAYNRFDYTEARALTATITTSATPITLPLLDIGSINVTGTGGVIGTAISGEHLGLISVSDSGFGVFDSLVSVLGDGTMAGVSAGGYGIRFTNIVGGASTGTLTARGDGTSLPITNFPANVRLSETGAAFDPVTGLPITFLNDLDTYLGTSLGTQQIVGSTESGVIENTAVVGSRDLGSLNAWSIRGRVIHTTLNPQLIFLSGLTTVNVANSVKVLNVTGPIDGLSIVTGRTTKFRFGGDVSNFSMAIAGPIGNLVFNSSLLGTSTIAAQGPSGRIQSVTIHGNFTGSISATRNINKIDIVGSMSGTIHANSLGGLKLAGGLGNGSLAISTNVTKIQIMGDLNAPGNTLTINGNLGTLQIGGNLNTNVSIAKNLKQLIVGGSILSGNSVTVANTITLLKVGRDVQAGATITAHIIKKKLIGGQTLGTITTA